MHLKYPPDWRVFLFRLCLYGTIAHMTRERTKGFTIVELLIVIVVIAILAAISVVAYTGIQERARETKIQNDVATIVRAIQAATASEAKTLVQITGSTATGSNCWGKASNTDLAALPKTDTCWTRYYTTLDLISAASGAQLSGLVDPWGRPYLIDENEGEGGNCAARDTVAVYKRPFTQNFGTYSTTPAQNVPRSGNCS